MGTEFRIVLYAPDEGAAARGFEAAFARLDEIDARLSDYRPESELSRLGRSSDGGPLVEGAPVSEDLWRVLARAQQLGRSSGGAFDVTVGPLVRLWRRARRQDRLPDPEELTAARERVGVELLELDGGLHRVRLLRRSMRLDLGGIGKGFALDEALATLRDAGIERALVDGGGDLALGEAPPGRAGWIVRLEPGTPGATPTHLELARAGIATSGHAGRGFELEGRRYSHILDPRSGEPLVAAPAASVFAPDATTADACASAACVLGPEAGRAWLESLPGVEGRLWSPEKAAASPCETSGFARRMTSLPPASLEP